MNTHYTDIELPPPSKKLVKRWSNTPPVYYWDEAGVRAAIEADRLKRDDYINDDRDQLRAEIVALKRIIADLEADRRVEGGGE